MLKENRLFDFLPMWRDTETVRRLAAKLAQQCRAVVLDCVRQQAATMTADMLRGYIRAYATSFASAALDSGVDAVNISAGARPKIIAAAVDQLIDLVIGDLQVAFPESEIFSAAA
jgi:hypothetical protein